MEVYGAYRSNVALVRDALRENKSHMARVDQSLGMFQTGLLCVEREMLPIYKLTEKLRATQKNIDLCVLELRKINANFLSATLLNGSKVDQDAYVQAMEKLLSAIAFLESHRSYEGSSKALEHARELLAQAKRKCKGDFVSAVGVLARGSRQDGSADSAAATEAPAPPATLVWSAPSKKEAAKVAQLLQCLLSASVDEPALLSEYGKQRFQVAKMALCDDDAAPTANSSSSSGASSSSLSIGFCPAASSMAELARKLEDVGASLANEKRLAEAIFPTEELAHAAFRYAAHPILDALRSDLDAALPSSAASAPSDSGSAAAKALDPFALLRLHELVVTHASALEPLVAPPLLLRDRAGKDRDDPWVLMKLLGATVTQLATAAKYRLFGFQLELTERIGVSDRSLAKDANVHPVSSYMLSFLRQVCDHTAPLQLLLARHESNLTPTSFVETAVMQLVEALQAKSAQLKGRSDLKHLFLANNLGYLAHALPPASGSATDDGAIAAHIQREVRPRLERLRDAAIAQFVDVSYGSFQSFLVAPTEKLVFAKGSDLLTLESGRLLKEKFARFNAQMDDLVATQRRFVVSEPHVRHQLIQAAVSAIVPQYTAFYSKYSSVHFSKKNSSKYLKYTPQAAEQALKELFLGEGAASTERK